MDWVLLCSIFVVIAGFVLDIIKSLKDKKDLSKEHNNLSKEHNGLSKEHDGLSKEHSQIKEHINNRSAAIEKNFSTVISQNIKQAETLNEINKELYGEIKKRDIQFQNLTLSQKDAYKQMEVFTFLMNEVKRLQSENIELKREAAKLHREVEIQNQNQNQTNNQSKRL